LLTFISNTRGVIKKHIHEIISVFKSGQLERMAGIVLEGTNYIV